MAASTPALFDTHAHLHDPAFDDDRSDVVQRAHDAGLTGMVTVGTDLETSVAAVAAANQHDGTWAAIGVHPHDAKDWDTVTLARMTVLANEARVVAIGEIGLDYFRDLSPRATQREVFAAQLALARELDLPVVIHSRDAHEETASILAAWADGWSSELPRGVLHCFSGDLALANRYVDLGFLISFAGPVTYPKNDDLREAAVRLRRESIVVETDCPYLSPQSRRGKRNEPANIVETARYIAELRGESLDAFAQQSSINAARLFRLPGNEKMHA